MEAVEEEIVVYLRGREPTRTLWYRVVLETSPELSKGEKREREGQTISPDIGIISPVAAIPADDFEFNGGWAVIGDDIYWAGGRRMVNFDVMLGKDLLKHNIHDDLTSWKIVSSLNIPRGRPFLAPVGRKLAIVAGTDHRIEPDQHDNWRNCGEIYDLDRQSFLEYITPDIKHFEPYLSYRATTVLEDPTQVVFYSLDESSVLILDASKGVIVENKCEPDPSLALCRDFSPDDPLPPGLEGCESITPLVIAATNSRAVFHKRTFYWFTSELMLYGYDMDLRKWFRSECLQQKLNPIKPKPVPKIPHCPLLLGLPNGKFLMIFFQKHGSPTMASFYVEKKSSTTTLDVNVDYIRYFHLSNPSVRPFDGIAM